ncbi:MAG: hypothetical protein IJW83_05590 [Clostridia bacterium]|nr:hypothetical protein [Clostridia bacterium]
MYARTNYPPGAEDLHIPQNYGGTALSGEADAVTETDSPYIEASAEPNVAEDAAEPCNKRNPWEYPPKQPPKTEKSSFSLGSLLKKLPFSQLLGDLPLLGRLQGGGLHGGKTLFEDSEDLLLIAMAACLFFSSGGDKLCALILLALLFFT